MSLFNLVEKHDGIGLSSHLFGKLPRLVKPHVSGRRADHFRYRVLFHILGHIYADKVVFVTENRLRKRFREFGFADAGRTYENKRADGAVGIFKPCARTPYRIRNGFNGVSLSHYSLVQNRF